MTSIRSMTAADAPAVSTLLGGSWRRTHALLLCGDTVAEASKHLHSVEALASESADVAVTNLVAVDATGRVTGYAKASADEQGKAWLDRLHVEPAHFGSGFAKALLDAVVAAAADAPSLALDVVEGNNRAIAFYRKHGFAVAERLDTCGDIGGAPTLVIQRALAR